MLRSLWNHPRHATFVMLAGICLMALSLHSYGDTPPRDADTFLPNISSHTMSNEELIETAMAFKASERIPGPYEYSQYEMNVRWLEAGMAESADYTEGSDALHKLATGMWKYYWSMVTTKSPGYNAYTPLVTGNFAVEDDRFSYGLRFSLDSVKLRFEYSF